MPGRDSTPPGGAGETPRLGGTIAEIVSPESGRTEPIRGAIEFENVSFAYAPRGGETEGEHVLHDVSFRVEPGQMVALVGATGAGKSTIASLVTRFYDATEGRVAVDGVDVREWDLERLRGQVATQKLDPIPALGEVLLATG